MQQCYHNFCCIPCGGFDCWRNWQCEYTVWGVRGHLSPCTRISCCGHWQKSTWTQEDVSVFCCQSCPPLGPDLLSSYPIMIPFYPPLPSPCPIPPFTRAFLLWSASVNPPLCALCLFCSSWHQWNTHYAGWKPIRIGLLCFMIARIMWYLDGIWTYAI